jgi:hypothetical protein
MCFCKNGTVIPLLDAGVHPVSNRYLRNSDEEETLYPFGLSQCRTCGLVQLTTPFPISELIPRYDWITYREPEDHLDSLVDSLCDLKGISKGSVIGGLSFKDDSTLRRFANRDFFTWRIDTGNDLHIQAKGAGIESIQAGITREKAETIAKKKGKADILIVRHILEHVYNKDEFITSLKVMINREGYIVFEVPDCSKSLNQCDYTMMWEEHLYYFTPETFRHALETNGFQVVRLDNIPYSSENSLVAITKLTKILGADTPAGRLGEGLMQGERFAKNFETYKEKFRVFFTGYKKEHGKIALFGAGHLACTFIWLFQLQDCIDCVLDDEPHKQGLIMPGSKIPIRSSSTLMNKEYSLCLLSINPKNEENVIEKNRVFTGNGGEFLSIFPLSKRSLYQLVVV